MMIAALRQTKGMRALAAKEVGCSLRTLDQYIADFPKVAEVVKEEREAMLDKAEGRLFAAIERGEAWAICFYLKTQGRHRHYSERLVLSDPDGNPIQAPQINVISVASQDLTRAVISGARTALPPGNQN